jgi:hypothetical protein
MLDVDEALAELQEAARPWALSFSSTVLTQPMLDDIHVAIGLRDCRVCETHTVLWASMLFLTWCTEHRDSVFTVQVKFEALFVYSRRNREV